MTREMHLSKGKVALVDDTDYEWLSRQRWTFRQDRNTGYAHRNEYINGKHKIVWMHRLIVNCPDGLQVDHINGNGLDNRRCNLRIVTHKQNTYNQGALKGSSSRFRGVWFHNSRGRFEVGICFDGKDHYLGSFEREDIAARVFDRAARCFYGEYARLNFPELPDLTEEEIEAFRYGRRPASPHRGVTWQKTKRKWRARIKIDGKDEFLGYFNTQEDAALAYNDAAIKYHGDKAKLNIIEEKV